jgi:O-succinylbenzoic acid--CoA ligase
VINLFPSDYSILELHTDEYIYHAYVFLKKWFSGETTFEFETSGSTGPPKKIQLTRNQLKLSAENTISYFKLTSTDHILVCLHPRTIAGSMQLARAAILNCEVTLAEPEMHILKKIPPSHPFTFVSLVPLQIDVSESTTINQFKHILIGGASIDKTLENKITDITTHAYHSYGMTETASHIAIRRLGFDTHYNLIPGFEIATDERSCLKIKGAITNNHWLQTNDIATIYSANTFGIEGRFDDIMISGGVKINLHETHQKILEILNKERIFYPFFICAVADVQYTHKLAMVIQTTDKINAKSMYERLKKALPKHHTPLLYFYTSAFSCLKSGKVDKIRSLKEATLIELSDV